MFNMDGTLMMANTRAELLTGAQQLTEFIGMPLISLLRNLPQVFGAKGLAPLPQLRELIQALRDDPDLVTRRTLTIHEPSQRVIEELSTSVRGHDGELLGRMFVLRDITNQYELETYRQEMSHMLVHDLRSPLGGVISSLSFAEEELDRRGKDVDLDLLTKMLKISLRGANSVLELVESILEVHKLESGELPLRLETVNLESIAQRAGDTFIGVASEAGIDVQYQIDV